MAVFISHYSLCDTTVDLDLKIPCYYRINMKRPSYARALIVSVIIALAVGFMLLKSFLPLILIAMIAAFLFNPVYEWLIVRTKKKQTAAVVTLLITFLVLIIPILLILIATAMQASVLVSDLSNFAGGKDFGRIAQDLLNWINYTGTSISGQTVSLTYADVSSYLASHAATVAQYVAELVAGWIGGVGSLVTSAVLYIYVFIAALTHKEDLNKLIHDLNPLGDKTTDLYIAKAQAMTKAMVKGQFVIALVQGIVSAFVLYLVGVPYTVLFLLVLTFLSIIPLGAGIVTIPLGAVMILLGNIPGGVIVILNHLIVVTNIDNVLKPRLVPKSVHLNPALLLLAVFGGMNLFGFLGIILGPVLMILIVTTLQIYSERIRTTNKAV